MYSLFRRGRKGDKKGGEYSDKEFAKALDRAMRQIDLLNSDVVMGIADIVGNFIDKVVDIGSTPVNCEL